MRLGKGFALLAVCSLFALRAMGDTYTYTYTGNAFGGAPPSPFSANTVVSGYFTVAQPIGNSAVILVPSYSPEYGFMIQNDLLWFSFTDGIQTIDMSMGTADDSIADFGVDSNGNIDYWGGQYGYGVGVHNPLTGGYIATRGDTAVGTGFYGCGYDSASIDGTVYAGNVCAPGTWTLTVNSTSVTPEPSAVVLLSTAAFAAAGAFRRRATQT